MMFLTSLNNIAEFLSISIEELPINIYTPDFTFGLCFYFDEDAHNVIVFVTDSEGREKLVSIQKKDVSYFEVVYQSDLDEMMVEDPDKYHKVSLYE